MAYEHTQFWTLISNDLLLVAIKPKAKRRFQAAAHSFLIPLRKYQRKWHTFSRSTAIHPLSSMCKPLTKPIRKPTQDIIFVRRRIEKYTIWWSLDEDLLR
jgi:hypothetical protein